MHCVSNLEAGAYQYQHPSRGKKCTIFKPSIHKEKKCFKICFVPIFEFQAVHVKFQKEGNVCQYQDPSQSKNP